MKKNFLLRFFPPPKYLCMPAAGVDISDCSVKYAEMDFSTRPVFLRGYGVLDISEGIIEAGEIKQEEKFVEFLKILKGKLKTRYIISDLPEEKAYIAEIKLPSMQLNQIRETLEMQMEEHVPLSGKEAVFDYDIIGRSADGSFDINLVAFPKVLAESYRNCIFRAGLMPVAFELEVQATAKAIISKQDINFSVMFIDFGKTRTTLAIVKGGKVRFASTVKIGGKDLENALVKNLQIAKDKAENYKKEYGLSKNAQGRQVFDAIVPIVSALKDEARKCINYWNSHSENPPSLSVSKIILCGGDANLIGFQEYLASELKMIVEIANPWTNIFSFEEKIPEMELKESLIYTAVIGLALRQYCEFG